MTPDNIPEILAFVFGVVVGAILVGAIIPSVNSTISNYNGDAVFLTVSSIPCTSMGMSGKFDPPPTEWYNNNCPVNISDSNMHEGLHYEEFCECYDYKKSKLLPWEKMK
jgi:hypothetical protein